MTAAPAPFDISVQITTDQTTAVRVRLTGEFDGSAVPAFDVVTTRIVDLAADSVVVDLAGVSLLDSAGIGALMRFRAMVQEQEADFALHAPQPFQQRLFTITGLAHTLAPLAHES